VISDGESFEDDGVNKAAKEAAESRHRGEHHRHWVRHKERPIPVRVNGSVVGFKKDKGRPDVL
jgi:hypothetical protein